MAFVVEDGTGLEDANAFISIAYADEYFTTRGVTAWTGSDGVKQGAIVRATDYINNRFRFKGCKYSEDQGLEFPRTYETDDPIMPPKLLKATAEYAKRALTGELSPDPVVDTTGLTVQSKTEKVGPLEESVSYQEGGSISRYRPYPAADMLLRDLIDSVARVIR